MIQKLRLYSSNVGGAWVQSMTEEVPHARNKLTNKIAIMSGDKLGKKEFSEP